MSSSAQRIFERTTRLDFLDGLGIAIHQRSVAMVHLVKRLATVSLQQHRLVPLPPQEEPEARRAALAAAVAAFVAEHSLDADRTFVSLPRASAVLSRLSLPAAAKSDLHQVIEFEIDRLIPLAREEIYYDTIVRDAGGKLDVMVMSVPRRVVAEALAALELAEVRSRCVVITPIAVFDFLRFCGREDEEHVVALIDDGGSVEFDYVARGILVASHLVRPQEVASSAAIARLVGQESPAAGGAPQAVKVYAWRTSTGPGAADQGPIPGDILASGAELLRRADGALSAPDGLFREASPALVPAIGAALGAVREGSAAINLLPEEERRAVEESAPFVTFLCAAVLVLVTLVWLASALVKDRRIAGSLHEELATLEPAMRDVYRNEEEAKALREKLVVLTQGDRRRISLILKELTEVVPQDAYLTTFRLRSGKIELEGFAKSASDLVPLLEKSPYFKNAQFTSPVTKVQDNQERFSLATEIEQ